MKALAAASVTGTGQLLRSFQNLQWRLESPSTKVRHVRLESAETFVLLQDDLLHPTLGGNKLRKLDAVIPQLVSEGVTDVVTCGGLQSAHTAAVAVACAEAGMSAHLLVRGEQPAVPTGYHLLSRMCGHVTYVPRSEYSDRRAMFMRHVQRMRLSNPHAKIYEIAEGAAEPLAVPGLVRLVHWLAESGALPAAEDCALVVDSGTGTTAIGLAIGIADLGLPWRVIGVMLAGDRGYYEAQQAGLVEACQQRFPTYTGAGRQAELLALSWCPRTMPRKFGRVLDGEVRDCKQIAKRHGVLLDPIYSLAAWQIACALATRGAPSTGCRENVAMLHCGGALGLHGLAQRFPQDF